MAKSRKNAATILGKTLEQSSSPAYLVTESGQVLFANQALAQWLGIELNQIPGCQLVYTSQVLDDPLQDRLKGLTPPAALFADPAENRGSSSFWVFLATAGPTQGTVYRRAHAVRFARADEQEISLLVVCEATEFPQIPDESEIFPQTHRWHLMLSRIRRENQLAYSVRQLAGTSSFASRLRRQVLSAASSSSDLLIVGPAGSGKQFLAQVIHNQSPAGGIGDLIPIQSSLASQEMIDLLAQSLKKKSQQARLSGKPEGLPGQHPLPISAAGKSGSEIADSGSGACESWLLLQVEQLSPESQRSLKHWVLEVGIPVRLLATAETDLVELAGGGHFDPELAAILSTLKLNLLPLADRLEDLPMLIQAVLDPPKPDRGLAGFDPAALAMLCEYRWPGNFDQLIWVIQEAVNKADREWITSSDLPRKFHLWLQAQRVGPKQDPKIDLEDFLASVEKELLVRAMLQAGGNKTRAAQLLSISRGKLLRRLEHFQIQLNLEGETSERRELDLPDHGDWDAELAGDPVALADRTSQADRRQPSSGRPSPIPQPAGENQGAVGDPQAEEDPDLIDPQAFKEVEG